MNEIFDLQSSTSICELCDFAGTGTAGVADGSVSSATVNGPTGVATFTSGNVIWADYSGGTIRKYTASTTTVCIFVVALAHATPTGDKPRVMLTGLQVSTLATGQGTMEYLRLNSAETIAYFAAAGGNQVGVQRQCLRPA